MNPMTMRRTQRGALMIEVLVTIVVVIIGTLGLIEMQGRLQKSEVESYQRTQAVILLNDMASRIAANRASAANYDSRDRDPAFYGGLAAELTCSTLATSPVTLQGSDAAQWCLALQGAGETQAGSSVGSMIGGRGCVEPSGTNQYLVTVVWQGTTPISAPPENITCGVDLYDVAGTDCVADMCRRYVTTLVSLARLDT